MFGFLSVLFTVAMPVILVVAVIIGSVIGLFAWTVLHILDAACRRRIDDIQGHHINR